MSVNLEAMELRKRLATEREQGAREERARIVAFLGRAVDTFTDSKHFEPKWSPATGTAVRDIIDAIERGEHEEKEQVK